MLAFLQLVATDLLHKFGHDLSKVVVVFPNKRASLFLNDYLSKEASQPIWAPRYITINELFRAFGDRNINDSIDTICRVHQHYVKATGDMVSLDNFYGWAERLLSDFEDVDKNMADASALFQNIRDLRELERTDYLTEEQTEVLQRFFKEFDPEHQSEIRERFSRLWNALLPIYEQLNAELASEGLAYEGAAFRRTVDRLKAGAVAPPAHVDKYVFVGFNVLDRVEWQLFSQLQKMEKSLFYWDYDKYYLPSEKERFLSEDDRQLSPEERRFSQLLWEDAEAGLFLRQNLQQFPNELPAEHFDNLRRIEKVEMVAASTETMQVQSVLPWLKENLTPDAKRTAVVLCNESLLQPLLHALPSNVEEVNVTKGFPLNHTAVSTLVERELGKLERQAQAPTTVESLTHLVKAVEEAAQKLVVNSEFDSERFEHILQSEAYAQMNALLNRLLLIAESGRLMVNPTTLRRIVRQIVRQSVIPFAGEPAVGLQVMGVLETRCLDFEHIIMLSVNEGVLPQKSSDNSFIPYLLRKAFGLTTPERKTAVYAYYFYRLIQRAKRLRLLYNSSSEGIVDGEKSRFLTQLMVESQLPIQHIALSSDPVSSHDTPQPVEKPADLIERLKIKRKKEKTEKKEHVSLSPSDINTYLRCQLRFYYERVLGIQQPKPDAEEVQPNTLGTIFHTAAELIYKNLLEQRGGKGDSDYFKHLVAHPELLQDYIRKAIDKEEVKYTPLLLNIIEIFLQSLLEHDAKHPNFRIQSLESYHTMWLNLPSSASISQVAIGGIIDRLDTIIYDEQERLRVVDYKTGGQIEDAKALEELFSIRGSKQKHYMLQTFIYAAMLEDEFERLQKGESVPNLSAKLSQLPIAPSLFFVHRLRKKDYSPYLQVDKKEVLDFQARFPEFREQLGVLVAEILNPNLPFEPSTKEVQMCNTCLYYSLCYQ